MRVQIQARVMQGGHRVAELAIDGDDLIQAILSFTTMIAPHLVVDRQVQIIGVVGWCEGCKRFHFDIYKSVAVLVEAQQHALKQMKDAVAGMARKDLAQKLDAVMKHAAGGDKGMNN